MKKTIFVVLILSLFAMIVMAKPDMTPAESKGGSTVVVPSHAVELAPGLFDLGTAVDADGRIVEGIMIVYTNKKAKAKPVCGNLVCEGGEKKSCPGDCGNSSGGGGDTTCFSTFAKGAAWKATEPYVVENSLNFADVEASLDTWDSEVGFNIFGAGSTGAVDVAAFGDLNNVNEVMLADYASSNTIAVTSVWGIFRGPPSGRELVEWDTLFNTDFTFGDATIDPTVMDFKNIAVHEFGHALGLTHPPDTCTEETMFAFADLGETKKRDLESGDLEGLFSLY